MIKKIKIGIKNDIKISEKLIYLKYKKIKIYERAKR